MCKKNIYNTVITELIIVLLFFCPLNLLAQSATCKAPYIFPIETEVLNTFKAKGQPQTEAVIKLKLPGFLDPSSRDIFTANYTRLEDRICQLESVTYEGAKVDCATFKQTTPTPVTDQQIAYAYLCSFECAFNQHEGIWEASFKIGATALKNLDTTKPKLMTLFDNNTNKISGAVTVKVTSDYVDNNAAALYSVIIDQLATTKSIASTNLNSCNYTFNLTRENIEILAINCQKKLTDSAAASTNVADINAFCEILRVSQPQIFYQALVSDCNTEHLDNAQTERDKVTRGQRALAAHFLECRDKCTQYEDCAGFAFNASSLTEQAKTCYLKSASCGAADDKSVAINNFNSAVTDFRFYKKVGG